MYQQALRGHSEVCWLSSFYVSAIEYWMLGSAPRLLVWFTERGNEMCSSFIWAAGFKAELKHTDFGHFAVSGHMPVNEQLTMMSLLWLPSSSKRTGGGVMGIPQARLMGIAFLDINKHDLQSTSIQQPSNKAAFFLLSISSESSKLSSSSSSSSLSLLMLSFPS